MKEKIKNIIFVFDKKLRVFFILIILPFLILQHNWIEKIAVIYVVLYLFFVESEKEKTVNKIHDYKQIDTKNVTIEHAVITGETAANAINKYILGIARQQHILSMIKEGIFDDYDFIKNLQDMADKYSELEKECYKELTIHKTDANGNKSQEIKTKTDEEYKLACDKKDLYEKECAKFLSENLK